jgi:hypothetical protein
VIRTIITKFTKLCFTGHRWISKIDALGILKTVPTICGSISPTVPSNVFSEQATIQDLDANRGIVVVKKADADTWLIVKKL